MNLFGVMNVSVIDKMVQYFCFYCQNEIKPVTRGDGKVVYILAHVCLKKKPPQKGSKKSEYKMTQITTVP